MSVVVVTSSIGEPGRGLHTPRHDRRADGVRYVAFVDRPVVHDVWETVRVDPTPGDSCRVAKRFKVLIAEHVGDASRSIWIDRHCRLICDPLAIWDEFGEDVGLVEHYRRCVYSEAKACRRQRKDGALIIRRTTDRWRAEGVPENGGLYYGGFVLRRHGGADDFSRLWWDLICWGSRRDQLSLPVALHRSGVSVRTFRRSRRPDMFKIGGK